MKAAKRGSGVEPHIETLAYKVETRAVTTITVHYDYVEIKMESNDDKSVPEPTT